MDPILEVKGLYKVFGEDPKEPSRLSKKVSIRTVFLNRQV